MSYLVLARKSRPQNFEDVVGQQTVVRTLQNALAQHRVPHALIFSGVRGTGKTTLARIMAKALNCEEGPTPTPCNRCRSCQEIAAGASVDLQEVDGASNRGIQEIRELKERIRFMPTSSRYKIVIIDEVHMLTVEAFNALLKTLEEPPDHVFFLFATTELHKVPVTILSRCQRYELRRIGRQDLHAHFKRLAEGEQVAIDDHALELIVREARGSVRDGLSLLDQLFSYCGSQVKEEDVTEVLGLVGSRAVADLADAVLDGDLNQVFTVLAEVYRQGMNQRRLTGDLLTWFRAMVVCKVARQPSDHIDFPEDDLQRIADTAGRHSLATLTALFNMLLEGFERADRAGQQRLALELVFIKAVQVREIVPVSELVGRLDALLQGVESDTLPPLVQPVRPRKRSPAAAETIPDHRPPVHREAQPVPPPVSEPPPPPEFEAVPEEDPEEDDVVADAEPETDELPKPRSLQPVADTATAVRPGEPSGKGNGGTSVERKDIRRRWDDFLKYVRERQPWIAAALSSAGKYYIEAGRLCIHFDEPADCRLLKNREYINPLTEFALDFFQEELVIRFLVPDSTACDIDPENGQSPQQERRALAHDPLVLAAVEIFNGQVGEIRVGPRYRQTLPAMESDEEALANGEETS